MRLKAINSKQAKQITTVHSFHKDACAIGSRISVTLIANTTKWRKFVHWLDGRKYPPYEYLRVIDIPDNTTIIVEPW